MVKALDMYFKEPVFDSWQGLRWGLAFFSKPLFWLWSVVYIMLQSSPRAKATSCEK